MSRNRYYNPHSSADLLCEWGCWLVSHVLYVCNQNNCSLSLPLPTATLGDWYLQPDLGLGLLTQETSEQTSRHTDLQRLTLLK